MKKIKLLSLFLAFSCLALAQQPISKWLHAGPYPVHMPVFAEAGTINNEAYKLADAMAEMTPLEESLINNKALTIFQTNRQVVKWQVPADSLLAPSQSTPAMHWLSSSVKADRWMKVPLKINTNGLFELYLDGVKIHTQKSVSEEVKQTLTLKQGVHEIRIRLIQDEQKPLKFSATMTPNEEMEQMLTVNLLSPKEYLDIHNILDGKSVSKFAISPSGEYFLI